MEMKQVRLWYAATDDFYYGFMVNGQFFFADNGKPWDFKKDPPDKIEEFPFWVDLHDEMMFHDCLN